MPPSPYLLWVNSRPTAVDEELWTKWYTSEHVPDLVNSKTSTRAGFYKDIGVLGSEPHPRKFLAVYQTEFEEPLKTEEYLEHTRRTSEMWPQPGSKNQENGEFNARIYKLIQDYDPENIGEAPSKFILTAELDPKDEGNFEKWYREEHLDMIHQVPGHRRSQRYVIGPKVAVMGDVTEAPKYLAIHEFDNIDAYKNKTPEASAPRETPWSKKQLSDSQHLYAARMFELIMPMGF